MNNNKTEIFLTWLVTLPMCFIFTILSLYKHEYGGMLMSILAFFFFLFFPVGAHNAYKNNVLKKPVKCVKAKLIKKPILVTEGTYHGVFLLANGVEIKLKISQNQYVYLSKNDNVTLMYQGWLVHSVKKDTDKIPLFNEEYSSGKKFAKYAFKCPLQSAKAKVVSKAYGDSVIFLLPDKSKIEMTVSKKQYKALKKGDMIDIIYQGWILHYIKKDEYEKAIFNEDFSSKKLLIEYMSKK